MCRDKIELDKGAGVVVFLGTMNAMPMMYALELKKKGYDVIYFVDRPVKDKLSRPENHFPQVKYPYPNWVVEMYLPAQISPIFLGSLLLRIINKMIHSRIGKGKKIQGYITCGFFTSLSSYIESDSFKVALPYGADLDLWGDMDPENPLYLTMLEKSIFKFFPKKISKLMLKYAIEKQYKGFLNSDAVVYFPKGFNCVGDRIISSVKNEGVDVFERYDVSFEPLKGESRGVQHRNKKKMVVFSGVRFLFKTFELENEGYHKGNDFIIKGLAKYIKEYSHHLDIHFVEKGPDVELAKQMCSKYGLADNVYWHKEMKFTQLLKLYRKADVCFDQVGSHWIGAIGFYALWLGKPLIANDQVAVKTEVWPKENPVCTANSTDSVYKQLVLLSNEASMDEISQASMMFADKYLGPSHLLNKLFEFK